MSVLFRPVPWSHSTNLYEVNIRQYTPEGSFRAFSKELPRLKEMGVEVLWLMPVTPISKEVRQGTLGSYYACSDYVSVNPEFGTLDDFRQLVQQAHGLGMKLIIDWVANHTGWDHCWTKKHPSYYTRNAQGQFYDKHGWHDVIDLNYYNFNMRQDMIAAMKFWVTECDIDGFRCDMAHLVPLDFWRDARTELDAVKPLFWLAETEAVMYHEAFDVSYSWNWMHQTEKFMKGSISLDELLRVLQDYRTQFPSDALRLYFTTNHDENSWNGTEYEKYGEAAAMFAVFSCTWNGLPLIYSGQELPNRKRLKFFDKDEIEWTGTYELHNFYKTLLQLRAQSPALRAGDETALCFRLSSTEDDQVLAFMRKKDDQEVVVILNFTAMEVRFQLTDPRASGRFTDIFSRQETALAPGTDLVLSAWGYLVLRK